MSNWIKIGTVGVDSGMLQIGDPCYLVSENPYQNWDEFIEKDGTKMFSEIKHENGHNHKAVVFLPGFGDGLYEVLANIKETKHGKVIKEIKIKF